MREPQLLVSRENLGAYFGRVNTSHQLATFTLSCGPIWKRRELRTFRFKSRSIVCYSLGRKVF